VGEKSSWVPPALIGLLTLSVSIQYTMVIGDSFSSIFSARRPSSLLAPPPPPSSHPHICEQAWGLPALLASRTGAIAALTAFGTLPLSLLPSLSALSFTSALGVAGLLYTAAFMVLRMSSYGPGSALHAAVPPPLRPRFEGALAFSPKAAVLPSPPPCSATT
jgi:sodium-coupled neutral amino acid transporter 11